MASFFKKLFGQSTPKRPAPAPYPEELEEPLPLRTDGIYCRIYEDKNGMMCNDVFRFFEEGYNISSVVSQTKDNKGYFPKSKWFNSAENNDCGRWERKGNRLTFFVDCGRGNINYKGRIAEDFLLLDSYSEITQNRCKELKYEFYQFSDIPGWSDD
ncbi:MAG: hypothetical protein IKO44_02560 [Ruminococcus sp.]|nr:hypothetical protein [Ruminococcus sp.]